MLLPSNDTVTMGFVAPADAKAVRAVEAAGATSLWVGGHIASPNGSPEAMVWLARLIEQTERCVVGTATLLVPLYPPAIIAKQLADLDRASNGRIALGIGVGGEYEGDFRAAEVPIAERGKRTDEVLPLLRRFWTGAPVTHDGRFHQFDDVRIIPPPAQPGGPPIIVTGRQPVAMRRAALLGDGWMPYLYSPRRYAESVTQVKAFAADAGRSLDDFAWTAYLFVSMHDDPDEARRHAAQFLGGTYKQDFDAMIDRVAVHGTPDMVRDKLQEFVDAGARHLVMAPGGDTRPEVFERLLHEILPTLEVPT